MKTARELADEALHKVYEVLNDEVPQVTYHEALDLVVTGLTEHLGYAEAKAEEGLDAEERRAKAKPGYDARQDE